MCPRCTQLVKAEFDEFVWRDRDGKVHFGNRMRSDGRFRDRVWPVLQRERRRVLPRLTKVSPCFEKVDRSIIKASKVSAARRWLPCNPLFARAMQVEDAWGYRRGNKPE